ncbi:hypothetical protein TRFO_26738 [Tritrichomonas foetus]|uniref:Uncharacterized protein n=1 Tax=Tritrichomonas foetus TaxID=1144522 RepID=A0A1J4K728_9EUKA|nr:hypothetical protein TRFO_26738 [Tritrichomonas foetus]|eukprot:OHT05526.1 hypothetical protein TRFO_26738 [Tritrichomonas foetus]
MAATGRIEELEALYNHIDLLNSKLDIFETMTNNASIIGAALSSANGERFKRTVDPYIASLFTDKPVSVPNLAAHQSFINSTIKDLVVQAQVIKYMYQFCNLTEHELRNLCQIIKDFDLRWNQPLTIRCCQIFVQYCKTILFIKTHPVIKYIMIMINSSSQIDVVKKSVITPNDVTKILVYVIGASGDPFYFMKTRVDFLSNQMARLSGTVGAFLARLFGTFPLVDFQQFSIFNKQPSEVETTLMSDEFIILSNLSLLKETLFFYLFIFYEASSGSQSFELIIESIFTESPKVSLSKTFMIPLQDLISFSSSSHLPTRIMKSASDITDQKFRTSHTQRMIHVAFLLQDILNIVNFRTGELPQLMNHIIALSGLAFYELDQYFTYDQRCPEALELLSVVLELSNIIVKNQEDVERFFTYNLAAVDLQFLKKQLSPAGFDEIANNTKELNIPLLLKDLAKSLEVVDLGEYDKGTRYDFTAFNVTYARYLRIFNDIKTRERVSFLDPIFEHLTTINFHIKLATSALDTFLLYCPIQTLWRHTGSNYNENTWTRHITDENMPLQHIPSILSIFTYFSLDHNCLRQLLSVVTSLQNMYSHIRQKVFERMSRSISQNFFPTAQGIKIGLQTHDFSGRENIFNSTDFATPKGITRQLVEIQYKSTNAANQLNSFCQRIPQNVIVFNQTDRTAEFMTNTLMNNLSSCLFPDKVPNPSLMDRSFTAATEFLWPVFAQLGSSFPNQIYQCRLSNSKPASANPSIAEQTKEFNGTVNYQPVNINTKKLGSDPKAQIQWQRTELILKIEQKFDKFVSSKWEKMTYLPTLKGFWYKNQNKTENSFFTEQSLRYIVENLGIYAGLRIDRIFIHKIASTINELYSAFRMTNSPELSNWYNDFVHKGVLPDIDQLKKGGINVDELSKKVILIGACLKMRELLLNALSSVVREAVPGLQELMETAQKRCNNVWKTEAQVLIAEAVLGDPNNLHFVEEILKKLRVQPYNSTINHFFFYLALLLNGKQFKECVYMPEFDAITENLLLVPYTAKAFLNLSEFLFKESSRKINADATVTFVSALGQIVQTRKNQNTVNSFTILADKVPQIMGIEYQRIEAIFPSRTVNFAYNAVEKKAKK